MEGFEEKLQFYFPEQPSDEATAEYLPERQEPLPEWATFFLRIGLKLAEKRVDNNGLESLVLSVPCRDLAASLICFGIIKGSADTLEITGLEEKYYTITQLEVGSSLIYKTENRARPAKYCGIEPSTGRIIIQVQANSRNSKLPTFTKEYLRKNQCDRLTLSEEEVTLPSSPSSRGRRIATNPLFLEAVLENKSRDIYVSNLKPQVVILGSLTQLNEEMKKQKFSVGNIKVTGCLDDLIMMRTRSISESSFGAYIASSDGDRSHKLSQSRNLLGVPHVIFDSSKSFLRWRRAWLRSNWIVVLSSQETSYKDAVVSVNEHVSNAGNSGLMEELVQCGIPSGVEMISFKRP